MSTSTTSPKTASSRPSYARMSLWSWTSSRPGAGPARRLRPTWNELAGKYPSVFFCKVDVDKSQELSERYSVSAMPTFKFFRNGKVVSTLTGSDKTKLKAAIEKLLV